MLERQHSLSGGFVNSSVNQFGYNFGAGVTRKMPSGVEIYANTVLRTDRTTASPLMCVRSRSASLVGIAALPAYSF